VRGETDHQTKPSKPECMVACVNRNRASITSGYQRVGGFALGCNSRLIAISFEYSRYGELGSEVQTESGNKTTQENGT